MSAIRETLVWKEYYSWKQSVLALLSDIVSAKVLAEFKETPPKHILTGNLSWLSRIVESVTEKKCPNLMEVLAERLSQRYCAIEAYHGCCPHDLSVYYEKGLRPLSLKLSDKYIKEFFLHGKFPELNETIVDEVISDIKKDYDYRDERVFFALDEDHLVKFCGHYLVYGSEYALEIATRLTWHKDLSSRNDYRKALKDRGIPTVFVCSINMGGIEQDALKELSGILIAETFRSLLDANHMPESRRFGFGISGALDPMFIVRHYHPKNVNDPLL